MLNPMERLPVGSIVGMSSIAVITYSRYAQKLNWDVLYIATATATVIPSLRIEWSGSVQNQCARRPDAN